MKMFSDVNKSVLTRRALIIDEDGDCTVSIATAVLFFKSHTIFN